MGIDKTLRLLLVRWGQRAGKFVMRARWISLVGLLAATPSAFAQEPTTVPCQGSGCTGFYRVRVYLQKDPGTNKSLVQVRAEVDNQTDRDIDSAAFFVICQENHTLAHVPKSVKLSVGHVPKHGKVSAEPVILPDLSKPTLDPGTFVVSFGNPVIVSSAVPAPRPPVPPISNPVTATPVPPTPVPPTPVPPPPPPPRQLTLKGAKLRIQGLRRAEYRDEAGVWNPMQESQLSTVNVAQDRSSIVLSIDQSVYNKQIKVTAETYFQAAPELARERVFCFVPSESDGGRLDDKEAGEDCSQRNMAPVKVSLKLRGEDYSEAVKLEFEGPKGREEWQFGAPPLTYLPPDRPERIRVNSELFEAGPFSIDPKLDPTPIALLPHPKEIKIQFVDQVPKNGTNNPVKNVHVSLSLTDSRGKPVSTSACPGISTSGDYACTLPILLTDKLKVEATVDGYDKAVEELPSGTTTATIKLKPSVVPCSSGCSKPVTLNVRPTLKMFGKDQPVSANDLVVTGSSVFPATKTPGTYQGSLAAPGNLKVEFKPNGGVPPSWQARVLASTERSVTVEAIAKFSPPPKVNDYPFPLELSKPIITVLVNPSGHFNRLAKDPRWLPLIQYQVWALLGELNDDSRWADAVSFRYLASIDDPAHPIKLLLKADSGVRPDLTTQRMDEVLKSLTFSQGNAEVSIEEAVAAYRKFLEGFSPASGKAKYRSVLVYVEADESNSHEETEASLKSVLEKEGMLVVVARLTAGTNSGPAEGNTSNFRLLNYHMPTEQKTGFAVAFQNLAAELKAQMGGK